MSPAHACQINNDNESSTTSLRSSINRRHSSGSTLIFFSLPTLENRLHTLNFLAGLLLRISFPCPVFKSWSSGVMANYVQMRPVAFLTTILLCLPSSSVCGNPLPWCRIFLAWFRGLLLRVLNLFMMFGDFFIMQLRAILHHASQEWENGSRFYEFSYISLVKFACGAARVIGTTGTAVTTTESRHSTSPMSGKAPDPNLRM